MIRLNINNIRLNANKMRLNIHKLTAEYKYELII